MAFPATDLPAASTWYNNVLITSALIQSNIIDPINLLPRGSLGSASDATTVTLSTTSAFAGLAPVTFTLAVQRRVRIYVQARFQQSSTTNARFDAQAGYNSGASAVIGSFIGVGQPANATSTITGLPGRASAGAEGNVLLGAGTYTAYASVTRAANGSNTDVAGTFYVAVTDIGAS